MAKPDTNAKQQILDKIRDVDTVLVAVNSNPSVDELSAAMGVTLALNKIGKHATAVFSGEVPMAIEFLEPGKTFENTVDSLRDFIIALDKEKADHLRYKVEGDMVKIFITPYRTTIDDSDLDFSQGDYNVQMVLAIGVRNEDDLDRALSDHGRIMHDATVAGIATGSDTSDIGSITWHDNAASSYSELLADLVIKLRGDKQVLDEQIATALLTGIVAATDRFSNERTSSGAMTLAAQLMAAGANQQLIATKLEEAEELVDTADSKDSEDSTSDDNKDGSTSLDNDVRTKVNRKPEEKSAKSPKKAKEEPVKDRPAADGTMTISHEKRGDIDAVAAQVEKDNQEAATRRAEEILAQGLADNAPAAAPATLSVAELQDDLRQASDEIDADSGSLANQATASPDIANLPAPEPQTPPAEEKTEEFIETPLPTATPANDQPNFGGTLNATSEQAAEDKRRAEEQDYNKKILSHDTGSYTSGAPAGYPAVNSFNDQPSSTPEPATEPAGSINTVSTRGNDIQPPSQQPELPSFPAPPAPTLAEIDSENRAQGTSLNATDAMAEALSMASSTDQQQQQVPNVDALPPLPSAPQVADASIGGLPPLPPMPDFSTLPPLPPMASPALPTVSPANQSSLDAQMPVPQPQANDPAAFQIPGQQ